MSVKGFKAPFTLRGARLNNYASATSVFESQRSRSTSTIAKRRAVYKKHLNQDQ